MIHYYLQKNASGKRVLILFIITMSIYLTMLLVTIPYVQSFAPNMTLLDLSPSGYSKQHVMSLFETLGDRGREAYLYRQLPLDFVYPILFAISYSLMLTWIYIKTGFINTKKMLSVYVPILAGFFDYLENISIVMMLTVFPSISETSVLIANTFTITKSVLTTLFFVLLLIALISYIRQKVTAKDQI